MPGNVAGLYAHVKASATSGEYCAAFKYGTDNGYTCAFNHELFKQKTNKPKHVFFTKIIYANLQFCSLTAM
jgi:hypothetical protein